MAPDRPSLEERLRGTFAAESREHPLRADFAASVSAGLASQSSARSRGWLRFGLPSAATAAILVVALAVGFGAVRMATQHPTGSPAGTPSSAPGSWLQLTQTDTADAWWSPDSRWLLVASGVTNGTPDQQTIALRDREGRLVRTMRGVRAEWIDTRSFVILDRDPSAAVGSLTATLVGSVGAAGLTPTGPPVVNGPGGFETNPVSNGHGAIAYSLAGSVDAASTFAVWTPTGTSSILPGVPVAWSRDGTQLAVWHWASDESGRQAQGWVEVLSWPGLDSVLQLKDQLTFLSDRQVQFAPSGAYLYLNGGFVDLSSGRVVGRISAGYDPEIGAWNRAEQFIVASRSGGDAAVFDVDGQQVATLPATGDGMVAAADGSLVVSWTVSEADPITLIRGSQVQQRLTVSGPVQPPSVVPAPDGSALVVGWAVRNRIEAFLRPVSSVATATPSTSASGSPAIPTQPPAQVTSTWARTTLPSAPEPGQPVGGPGGGVSALPDGGFIDFVVNGPERTYVFTSPDGMSWTQRGTVTGFDANGITGPVASNGSVYLALGAEGGGTNYGPQYNGAAWVSTDLVRWTKVPAQGAFAGVTFSSMAGGPAGFVAVGQNQATGNAALFSSDGQHWSVLADAQGLPKDTAVPLDVIHTDTGFVMVGQNGDEAASWTSSDGQRWTQHSPLPEGTGVTFQRLVMDGNGLLALAVAAPGIQVRPGDLREPVAPWTSRNGVTWQAHAASPALLGAAVTIVAAPGGYVAAGTLGAEPGGHLWTSTDGLSWTPVAGIDLSPVDSLRVVSDGRHVLLLLSYGSALVLVGAVHAPPATAPDSPTPTGAPSVPVASSSGAPLGGPSVSATDANAGFTLTMTLDHDRYRAGQPIVVTTTLTYSGPHASVKLWTNSDPGPVGFDVIQVGGPLSMPGGGTSDCVTTSMARGQTRSIAFSKVGGWSNDDPYAAFYQAYYTDKQLRLPAGTWQISAKSGFAIGGSDCGSGADGNLRATLQVVVEP